MASTNKTTNYELSQFLGTDKPAWLTDYNSDMSKIDNGIHTAQSTATGADGKADANATSIGTLTNLTTDVKTDLVSAINEVDGHADTAQSTATNANTAATTANTKITAITNYLDLVTFYDHHSATSTSATISDVSMHTACNVDGSLGKVYGSIDFTPTTTGNTVITLTTKSSLRPASTIAINALGFCFRSGSQPFLYTADAEIDSDGTVRINGFGTQGLLHRIVLHPCLLFMKDFGDVINPEAN